MRAGIEARGVGISTPSTTVLSDISLTLAPHRIHGLVGRNGSGKSSLLSVLGGLCRPTRGRVLLDGLPVLEHESALRRICLVGPSSEQFSYSATVASTLAFAASLRPDWDHDYARALVARFRLPLERPLRHLSGGTRAAVSAVVGLASRAPVTLFDECQVGMDTSVREIFFDEILADTMARPRTVVIAASLAEEIGALCDEMVILDQGHVVLQESTDFLRLRGLRVTGAVEAVDRFAAELLVLDEHVLGRTKTATVYGRPPDEVLAGARAEGIDLGPIDLQELFLHLTREPRRW
ncbi:ABC transporter ATP-binding protein [Nocardiopsis sp. MG754419]|uniref:ATP-binding cassette domain-containing protein n=1 Tax=Nocardiopsis sp. MG754419 TaxID=2259865 RepID=UPI001BAE0466|nr:ABC transporter ATP-binding protein [Nocardiopsis sp. MG754419]